jgi:hypothetical protein
MEMVSDNYSVHIEREEKNICKKKEKEKLPHQKASLMSKVIFFVCDPI